MSLLDDLLSLFFPRLCYACETTLRKNEDILCSVCINSLPKTEYHLKKENPVTKIFWGRAPVRSATAYYYFNRGNKVQHLVHQLKYKGAKEIGIYIGEQMAGELKNTEAFGTVEMIVPVPLHPRKKKKRGYNQSEMFGLGLARGFHCPMDTTTLRRKKFTETQTKKSRSERWKNVGDVFVLNNSDALSGKHILLVDDVITTGSTLEACAHALMQIPGTTLSIAAIATALKE